MNLLLSDPAFLFVASGAGYDPDAAAYIAAVETADGQALETAVKDAINAFVVGCKADGIWSAIKASCILAGARTLNGALVPLAGTAPTNYNFVSADYNRKTGLVGDGSTKYLNSNRNNNADPQDSKHVSVHVTTASSIQKVYIAASIGTAGTGATNLGVWVASSLPYVFARLNSNAASGTINLGGNTSGFIGANRSNSSAFVVRALSSNFIANVTSQSPLNANFTVLSESGTSYFSDGRIAFYSIGESLNLALLDARVTTLINAFAAAIP